MNFLRNLFFPFGQVYGLVFVEKKCRIVKLLYVYNNILVRSSCLVLLNASRKGHMEKWPKRPIEHKAETELGEEEERKEWYGVYNTDKKESRQ